MALPLMRDQITPHSFILMDDAHQHHTLYKDLSFIVVNNDQKFGNQCVFPAGPLRENYQKGMDRADGFFLIHDPHCKGSDFTISTTKPIFDIDVHYQCALKNCRVIGFCGVGYPPRFRNALALQGLDVCDCIYFPNHHKYTALDEKKLIDRAEKSCASLITTAKDWVRLSPRMRSHVDILGQSFSFQKSALWNHFLKERIGQC